MIHSNTRGLFSNKRCEILMRSIAWSPLRGRKLSKSKYSVLVYVYKLLRCANLHKDISVCLGRRGMVDYRCQYESSFLLSSFSHSSMLLCCLPPLFAFFPFDTRFHYVIQLTLNSFYKPIKPETCKKKPYCLSLSSIGITIVHLHTQLH